MGFPIDVCKVAKGIDIAPFLPWRPIHGRSLRKTGVWWCPGFMAYYRGASEAALRRLLLLAGCCPPPPSPVRPLSNALRAFNTLWPWAPCEAGLNGRLGWIEARIGRRW